MKTTIVCGLLGSGKTTFIQNFLKGRTERVVVLVNVFGKAGPDRYGHTFQILDAEEGSGEKKVIERTEAVRHILAIMKKLGVRWQRTPKQLPGWRDSL